MKKIISEIGGQVQTAFFIIIATIVSISFVSIGCGNSSEKMSNKVLAEKYSETKSDTAGTHEKDAQFLINIAEINLEEIKLGQLAQKNSNMPEVKSLAKMLEEAHTNSFNQLTVLAQNKVVTIPAVLSSDGNAFYEKMQHKTGHEFDKEYCDIMVNTHKDAINQFENASEGSSDPDIRMWASQTLPSLREHLDLALSCQTKYAKVK